jgi:hypothetical protein
MLTVTRDLVLPTTITGSYPKPNWYTQGLHGRPFKVANLVRRELGLPEAPIRAADPHLTLAEPPMH